MSFRDDHDAAISRIAALEHELATAREDAREQSERERGRIAMLEREIAELRRGEPPPPRRARPPSAPPVAKAQPAQPKERLARIDELSQRGPAVSGSVLFAMILLAGALIGALLWFVMLRPEIATTPAVTTCEIRSQPPYADVIGMRRGEEIKLGIAPVERSFEGWREYSRIVLRLPGHGDVIVEPPSSLTTCPVGTIELTRRGSP